MDIRLKQVREACGKTQEDVSNDLSIPIGTYRNWEQGGRDLNGKKLVMLAKYFHVSTDTILGTDFASTMDTGIPSHSEDIAEYGTVESQIFELLKMLNKDGKAKLLEYADDLVSSGKYEKSGMSDNSISIREIA